MKTLKKRFVGVKMKKFCIYVVLFFKEKGRLEEALSSENGQQQLAIRTYKIQLNKQKEKINSLQNLIEQMKIKKEEEKNAALEVSTISSFVMFSLRLFLKFFNKRQSNSMKN